jgi:ribose 5-phosphate isomerase B
MMKKVNRQQLTHRQRQALETQKIILAAARELFLEQGYGATTIAANKMRGIYCAITHDAYSAAQGVQHDNMNVMAIGGKVVSASVAESLADAFLNATFQKDTERYLRRFMQVQAIENDKNC